MPRQPAEPLYRRIMRDIEGQIERGELRHGDKLPPRHELADKYKCSEPTVRDAINRLQDQGVLQGHQGRGIYVGEAPS